MLGNQPPCEQTGLQKCIPVRCVPSAAVAISWGVSAQGGVCQTPPLDRMTDICGNITFPQLLLRTEKTLPHPKLSLLAVTIPDSPFLIYSLGTLWCGMFLCENNVPFFLSPGNTVDARKLFLDNFIYCHSVVHLLSKYMQHLRFIEIERSANKKLTYENRTDFYTADTQSLVDVAAAAISGFKNPLPCENLDVVSQYKFVTSTFDDTKIMKTRMHSSRMRTARSLQYRGISLTETGLDRYRSRQRSLWTETPPCGQNDRHVKTLPCPKLRLRVVIMLLPSQCEQECIPVGCVPSTAMAVPGGVCQTPLPLVDRMIDTCKNITLPQLRCGR